MRTKIIIWSLTTLSFSYLFHMQSVGVNFTIFSALILMGTLITFKERSLTNILCMVSLFLSGISSLLYGNNESIAIGLIAILALSYLATTQKSSFLAGVPQGLYKLIVSPMVKFSTYKSAAQNTSSTPNNNRTITKFLYLSIPILIAIVFVILYGASNEAFNNFIYNIDWKISPQFVFLLIVGSYFSFGFYFTEPEPTIKSYDQNSHNKLQRIRKKILPIGNVFFKFKIEVLSGVVLFVLLNLILSTVIIIDIVDLFNSSTIQSDSTYSDNVHAGIQALIVSIIAAIGLILYYFRGTLNFYSKNKTIRALSKVWVLLNIIFVVSTLTRTFHYIDHLGLTYKRIGVIIYLALTLIGLYFTWIKIQYIKTNWFLMKKVFWCFFLFMSFYPLINWDNIITKYNCRNTETPDIYYLTHLNNKNLAVILSSEKFKNESISGKQSYYSDVIFSVIKFIKHTEKTDFRSFNIVDNQIQKTLLQHQKNGDFDYVEVDNPSSEDLETLSKIESIKHIKLTHPYSHNHSLIYSLQQFKSLKRLTIKLFQGREGITRKELLENLPDVEINFLEENTEY